MESGGSDDELFEQLEAELEKDGTFDYYRTQQIKSYQNMILKHENIKDRLKYFDKEKQLLDYLSTKEMKMGNYMIIFINETFTSCQSLLSSLTKTLEESDGNYTICIVDATVSPFLVEKLNVKTLPTIIAFKDSAKIGMKIGLDGLLDNPQDISTVSYKRVGNLFSSYFPYVFKRETQDDDDGWLD